MDLVDFPPASFAAVGNTVTRTNLWTPNLWTQIPAGDMKAGKMYRVNAGGIIQTTATPTVIFNATFGQSATPASNITFGVSATVTTGTIPASSPWYFDFIFGCRQVGVAASTSTVTGNGVVSIAGSATAQAQDILVGGTVITTADQTTAQGVVLDITWGTQNASNTITCQWASIRSMN